MQRLVTILGVLRQVGRKLGPYVLLEVFLPGGTLVALALFLYRYQRG